LAHCCRYRKANDPPNRNPLKAICVESSDQPIEFILCRASVALIPFPNEAKSVHRQSFWDRERLKIRESLARLVCNIMRLADGAASGDWRLSVV
jgi:hypothetical protein